MIKKYNNLFLRILTALVCIPLVVGLIQWHAWGYFFIFLIILVTSLLEYYTLISKVSLAPLRLWGILAAVLLYTISFLCIKNSLSSLYGWLIIPICFSGYFIILYRKRDPIPFTNLAHTFLGIIYIALPFILLHRLAFYQEIYHPELVLGMLWLIWTNDIGAYFTGSWFGKHLLFERLSPKKTWEGAFGGITMTIVVSQILAYYYPICTRQAWFIIGVIISIVGVYGDLLESLLKRSLHIKDSGTILPGHGGFLDRFDSLLLVIPFIVAFVELYHKI